MTRPVLGKPPDVPGYDLHRQTRMGRDTGPKGKGPAGVRGPRGCVRGPTVCQGPSPPTPTPQIRGSRGAVSTQGSHPSLISRPQGRLFPSWLRTPGGCGRVINLSHTDSQPDAAFINMFNDSCSGKFTDKNLGM